MGLTSSRETAAQSATSPTHNDSGDMASMLAGTAVTNVTPTTTIKRTSPSKSAQNNWKQQQQNHHVRQASVRSRAALPMPDHSELDKRFAKVLVRFFLHLFLWLNRTSQRYLFDHTFDGITNSIDCSQKCRQRRLLNGTISQCVTR